MECYYISTMREIHLTDDMQNEDNDISQIVKRDLESIKTDTCINIDTRGKVGIGNSETLRIYLNVYVGHAV